VNAAKLAEGEGPPTQGLQGLEKIWFGLREDRDMHEPEAWVETIPSQLRDAITSGKLDSLGRPSPSLYDPRLPVPAFLQDAANWISNNVNDASWMATVGRTILESLQKVFQHKAIGNLEPIRRLINGNAAVGIPPALSPALVAAWGNNGQRKLRLATVSLESGELRYVDEMGHLLEADAVTPVLRPVAGPVPPACTAIQSKVDTLVAQIKDLQDQLHADPSRKRELAGGIANLRHKQFELQSKVS
jgi:hypothetical protein